MKSPAYLTVSGASMRKLMLGPWRDGSADWLSANGITGIEYGEEGDDGCFYNWYRLTFIDDYHAAEFALRFA